MEDKKSVVIYLDYKEVFELLTPEQCKELILAILTYDGSTPNLSPMVKLASIPIFNQMKRDKLKWEDIKKKRADAGRKGGKITQFQANQAIASSGETSKSSKRVANQAVNVNVNGNVTVTDTVINNKKEIDKEKIQESDFQEIADKYHVPLSFVLSTWDDLQNWCDAKGKSYKDYKAALRNWVKSNVIKIHERKQHAGINVDELLAKQAALPRDGGESTHA